MISKNLCSGCSACLNICPKKAISMKKENGFLYPSIDYSVCIDCHNCEKICPQLSSSKKHEELFIIAAYAKDENIRKNSSSGGIFSLFAQKYLSNNGIVIGCAMAEDFKSAKHIAIKNEQDLRFLRGSKYLQSQTGQTFSDVKKFLLEGKNVLFSGTPCQVAGLSAFIPDYMKKNLLTIDVICHGVPSPLVWEKYIEAREKEAGAKTKAVSFRKKTDKTKEYSLFIEFENGKTFNESIKNNFYLRGFVNNLFLRPSCYNCEIKNNAYKSDITLADYWGAEDVFEKEEVEKGISLVITHSEKGKKELAILQTSAFMIEVNKEAALKKNQSYYKKAKINSLTKNFMKDIKRQDIDKVLKKYCSSEFIPRLKRKIYKLFK